MTVREKLAVCALGILPIVAAVLCTAGQMAPVSEGTSAEFWRHATGVGLAENAKAGGSMGGVYLPRDGWFIYYDQGYDGQFLYRVPRAEAAADYPEVIRRLEAPASPDNQPLRPRLARDVIQHNRAAVEHDPEAFLVLLHEAHLRHWREERPESYQYVLSEEVRFTERWACVGRYWLNILFECAFFSGLLLFAFWPWLRRLRAWRWAVHLGLLPLLLLVPYYLGYAGWTFTSMGPSGGVLYPWVIVWFRGVPPWTPLDQWAIEALPKVLEPLSQPLGPWLSGSGGQPLGLVAALIAGGLIAAVTGAVRRRAATRPMAVRESRFSVLVRKALPGSDFASRPRAARFLAGAGHGAAIAAILLLIAWSIAVLKGDAGCFAEALWGISHCVFLFALAGGVVGLLWKLGSRLLGALAVGLAGAAIVGAGFLSIAHLEAVKRSISANGLPPVAMLLVFVGVLGIYLGLGIWAAIRAMKQESARRPVDP